MSQSGSPLSQGLLPALCRFIFECLGGASVEAALSLNRILEALNADDLHSALRSADRAWRTLPDEDVTFACVFGWLLALTNENDAALRLLDCAISLAPDPDIAGLTVTCLLRLQRYDHARAALEMALQHYCVKPQGLLAHAAGEFVACSTQDVVGWIGRGARFELVGELPAAEPRLLVVRIDGGAPYTQLLAAHSGEGRHWFSFDAPYGSGASVEAASGGTALIGSGLVARAGLSFDGRARVRGRRRISGWARLGWLPREPARLRVEDEFGGSCDVAAKRSNPGPGWRWPFEVDLSAAGIRGNQISVSAKMPDGRWQLLPDAPLCMEPARVPGQSALRLRKWSAVAKPIPTRTSRVKRARTVDVVIPVYRGREETLACIDAVLSTVDDFARIIVVDDATDEPELVAALNALEADGRIQLLRNPVNLGFVASVNRGLQLSTTHDVLLLNSDTLVFGDWLPRLRAAAYSEAKVGTVTPLSNSGSIASYPQVTGSAIDADSAAALHALATAVSADTRVEIPVGVGFCLFIRRDCLRDVGLLDAAVFGKGYGEETDFCLRARQQGWSHQLAADVYVYHAGGVSFGSRRQALLERSQRLINARYPGYDGFIQSFLKLDPLQGLRRRLDAQRLLAFEGRFVLYVTLALTGGVARFVTRRSGQARDHGYHVLLLRPVKAGDSRQCELSTDALDVPNLRFDVENDLAELAALLEVLDLQAVELQHFLHLDARVIEVVRALPVPYDVFIHDYAWLCPRVTMIDGAHQFCGEPALSVCETCVKSHGSKIGEPISVAALRQRSTTWLHGAHTVVAPSMDTSKRMRRYFPDLSIEVRAHADRIIATPLLMRPGNRDTLRVVLIGGIGTHKGYRKLLDCALDARIRCLPLDFVVIGHTEDDASLLATDKVFVTGLYEEVEVPYLLQREQPDIAWLPSVWPETWCYALDHALEAGLPVAAFELGAIAERLQDADFKDLMPLNLQPSDINERLLTLGDRKLSSLSGETYCYKQVSTHGNIAKMAENKTPGCSMAKSSESPVTQATEDGLRASVQVLPLPSGLYLFSVKASGGVTSAAADSQLQLPALHVGLAPGVKSEQVEFIAGPSTHGAWLFSPGDLLVTKVNGSGATLIMTSVRGPGGETLSIKVERLEDRAASAPIAIPLTNGSGVATATKAEIETPAVFGDESGDLPLPMQILAHIRTRGDMKFVKVAWAGRVAPGLWIESFSIRPLERFGAADIEYKGLTGSGFETPWMSDEKMCGTKGMATPLVGFAIRLKPSPSAAAFDCEYSGYFASGTTVGPLRNGAPCRSSVANDSLEGVQIRIVKRASVAITEASPQSAVKESKAREAAPIPQDVANNRSGAPRRPPSRRP